MKVQVLSDLSLDKPSVLIIAKNILQLALMETKRKARKAEDSPYLVYVLDGYPKDWPPSAKMFH